MTEALAWLAGTVLLPLAVVWASHGKLHVERLRRLAASVAAVLVVLTALPLVVERLRHLVLACPPFLSCGFAEPLLRVDTFSSLLLPFAALMWLVTLAATPRARLDRQGIRRTAWATLGTLLAFSTTHPVLLTFLWVASIEVFSSALDAHEHRPARRVMLIYLGTSSVLLATGVVILALSHGTPR